MRLDRNLSEDGTCRYALVDLRKFPNTPKTPEELAHAILNNPEAVNFGRKGEKEEFFAIKLKDINAKAALIGYISEAIKTDPELAIDVLDLLERSGPNHPNCKIPD